MLGLADTFETGFLTCLCIFTLGIALYLSASAAWDMYKWARDYEIKRMIREELDAKDEDCIRRE